MSEATRILKLLGERRGMKLTEARPARLRAIACALSFQFIFVLSDPLAAQ